MVPDLTTTNILLGIIAGVGVLEGAVVVTLLVNGVLLCRGVLQAVHRLEEQQLTPALTRVNAILDDVHAVTSTVRAETGRMDRIAQWIAERFSHSRHAAAGVLRAAALAGVTDVAAAYASVAVRFDARALAGAPGGPTPFARLAERIEALLSAAGRTTAGDDAGAPATVIPVCYGGTFGPDLDALAAHAGLEPAAVIALHAGAAYRVAMLGFMPGFPYLLGLDARLQMPRRTNPRTSVPRGSVAIGGAQTGIYPRELPGGWHLIGRTPLDLFDARRAPPALLQPGQALRFRAIGAHEFATLQA